MHHYTIYVVPPPVAESPLAIEVRGQSSSDVLDAAKVAWDEFKAAGWEMRCQRP